MGSYGAFGRNIYEDSITCRSILTDPQITIELIQRHRQQASNIYRYFFQKIYTITKKYLVQKSFIHENLFSVSATSLTVASPMLEIFDIQLIGKEIMPLKNRTST